MMAAAEPPPGQNSVLLRPAENLLDLYFMRRVLEIGKFGKTYLCMEKATGQEYACKSFVKSKLVSQEDVDDVRREIEITQLLSGHPNVAAVKGVYEDSTGVHLVLEHCSGGELIDRLIRVGRLSEAKVAQLTRVIVGVVEACHSLNIMHRDVRPEKFLLSNNSEDAALKALGFETSVFFQPGEVFTESPGSPYYVAPEVIRRHYGPEADIWSAGVTLYLLLSGVPPFWPETPQGSLDQVLRGEIDLVSEPWPVVSESAKDLVRRMLHVDPQQRLRAHEVLRHPWIQGLGIAPDTRPTGPAAES